MITGRNLWSFRERISLMHLFVGLCKKTPIYLLAGLCKNPLLEYHQNQWYCGKSPTARRRHPRRDVIPYFAIAIQARTAQWHLFHRWSLRDFSTKTCGFRNQIQFKTVGFRSNAPASPIRLILLLEPSLQRAASPFVTIFGEWLYAKQKSSTDFGSKGRQQSKALCIDSQLMNLNHYLI